MPRPVDSAIGQSCLDQCRVVLFLPPESRKPAVQYLDRPPFSHCGDGTSCSWIPGLRTGLILAQAGGRLMFRRSRECAYSRGSGCPGPRLAFILLNPNSIGRRRDRIDSGPSHSHAADRVVGLVATLLATTSVTRKRLVHAFTSRLRGNVRSCRGARDHGWGRRSSSGCRVAMAVGNPPLAGFAAVHLGGPQRVGARLAVNRDRGVLPARRVGHVARYVAGLQVEGV